MAQTDQDFEVDLDVHGALESTTASRQCRRKWSGPHGARGDKGVAKSMQQWLGLSPFAKEKSSVPV